ncbi:hypothetical protein JP28_01160 [Gallibacterium anatis]|uniref:Uncharacterized protein n=1 Tax=Gallibacterium anatis 12656/12 TaxID=1195244 RepID=U1I2V8_9PAST|nr:hypothetical protein [Gallibacterium anatis]ERF77620.1 hypothetical protein N561_10645 [Gallibacterium anatis 12656/12]KGQ25089.1 hypothetical protein JP31_07825 [Gallibacterium anatis]KGQ26494.1 hypothetical protein JP27_07030 [Gallibacterium anatis]KGQ45378.1 hypothetical protein JP28_01160 [Gallibacterium anatis]KGQ50732.1 hypothetical protein IO46_08825 [Gallibacterium anatis]
MGYGKGKIEYSIKRVIVGFKQWDAPLWIKNSVAVGALIIGLYLLYMLFPILIILIIIPALYIYSTFYHEGSEIYQLNKLREEVSDLKNELRKNK